MADNAGMNRGTALTIIRHGETDWNRQHRFQGQIDVPLNALGLEQARRLGQRLKDEAFDVLVCSDLQRTRSTAAPLAGPGRPDLLLDAQWREQHFGVLEGLDVPSIARDHAPLWAQWQRHEADYALPQGGESNNVFHARVMAALNALVQSHLGQRLLVVTHGGVLDMLWRTAQGLPLTGPRQCEIPNTGINRLRCQDGQLRIEQWADASHLAGLPEQPSTLQRPSPSLPEQP